MGARQQLHVVRQYFDEFSVGQHVIPPLTPSTAVIAVDEVNKIWFFGQYDSTGALVQAQWALPNSAYVLQGGTCYPRRQLEL